MVDVVTPRARTIILTDASTVVYSDALAAYDGTAATPTPSPTPTPAPSFSVLPSIAGTLEVGQTLAAMDGTILYATEVSRRWLLGSAIKSTAATWLASSAGELVLEVTATGPGGYTTAMSAPVRVEEARTGTPTPFSVAYAQGMGATAVDGMVSSIPLPTNAKRMYLDTRSGGGASDSYNGLSPYPGFRLNGTGADNQYGATGRGAADAAYGPKLNFLSAEGALGAPGVGHQTCLAEGGTYVDPPASVAGFRATGRYGASATAPYTIQSYDPADPTNEQRMGRATGNARPKIRLSDGGWNFTTNVNNGGGTVSNFAFRGLAFVDSSGSRNGAGQLLNFSQIDGSNYLFENIDLGGRSLQINNNSNGSGNARWSQNVIIRKCLFDHWYGPGTLFAAVHTSGWVGVFIEDNTFLHCSWSDTAEDRYVVDSGTTSAPTFFMHDIYNAGGSQWPNVVRRNVSFNPAATFCSNRNNLEAYQNVIVNAPIAGGAGGGVANITIEQPNGNYVEVHHNLSAGSQMIQAPRVIFSANPSSGYIMAGGYVLGFSATPTEGAIPIGSTITATVDNAVAALNASSNTLTSRVLYRRYGQEIRQTMKEPGTPYVMMSAGGVGLSCPDPLFRSFPFGLTGPVLGSEVHHNLSINSGYMSGAENMLTAGGHGGGAGADGVVSYGSFHDNKLIAWTPSPAPGNVDTSFYHGTYANNIHQTTSPYTNKQVWQALGYSDEDALQAAIIADHTQPWALTILAKVKQLFGHDFEVPTLPAPTLVSGGDLSSFVPKVGVSITFPDPIVTGGTIVSATTYVDNMPLPNTGKTVKTLAITNAMLGKRLSRMVVVKSNSGGPSATWLMEIPTQVGSAPAAVGRTGRYLRFEATEVLNPDARVTYGDLDYIGIIAADNSEHSATWIGSNDRAPSLAADDGQTYFSGDPLVSGPWRAQGDLGAQYTVKSVVMAAAGTSYNSAPGRFTIWIATKEDRSDEVVLLDVNEPNTKNWSARRRVFPVPT